MARTWWVNQGRSGQLGHDYDVVWAPLYAENGKTISSWDSMDRAAAGDLLVHYARGAVRGFSVVLGSTRAAPRPFAVGDWNEAGRILDVEFAPLDIPVTLSEIPLHLRLAEPKPHAAFTINGEVNQGYFYPVSWDLASATLARVGIEIQTGSTGFGDRIFVNGATDREGVANIRAEQPEQRRRLLNGRSAAPCALCGVTYPADYLVTAHIKKRKDCSEKERTDTSVVMLACLFGCDAAYERGHLRVDRQGRIVVEAPAGPVADRLTFLQGARPEIFSNANRRYFACHWKYHGVR
jgi:hypothetical protein